MTAFFISFQMTGNFIPQIGMGSTVNDGSGVYLLEKLDLLSKDLGFNEYTVGSKSILDIFCITPPFVPKLRPQKKTAFRPRCQILRLILVFLIGHFLFTKFLIDKKKIFLIYILNIAIIFLHFCFKYEETHLEQF